MNKFLIKRNQNFYLSRRARLKRPVLTARQRLLKNSFPFRITKWSAIKKRSIGPHHNRTYGVLGQIEKFCELKHSSHKFSVVLKIVEGCVSQVYLLVLVDSSRVCDFIRGVFVLVGIILCYPEYTFCMELNDIQDVTDSLPVFSNLESTLEGFETSLRESYKEIRNPDPDSTFDLDDYRKKLNAYSNQIETTSNEVRKVDTKTHAYSRLSDLKQRFEDLKQTAINQQKSVSDHNSLLEPSNSPLWSQLKNSTISSVFALTTATSALVLTLVVLGRTSK